MLQTSQAHPLVLGCNRTIALPMTALGRQYLMVLLMVSFGMRIIMGAPCCMVPLDNGTEAGGHAQHSAHAAHTNHPSHASEQSEHHLGDQSDDPHAGHGDDATAKPCCSACGPTLPAEPALLSAQSALQSPVPQDEIRALATRPPFPAFDATGPPLLI